jgi:hypothetical protein
MPISSETSVDIQRTTQLYNPEDRTLHNQDWEFSGPIKLFTYVVLYGFESWSLSSKGRTQIEIAEKIFDATE